MDTAPGDGIGIERYRAMYGFRSQRFSATADALNYCRNDCP